MSVIRQGGTFLQRRLTKLYTDTKSSCESVSTAARPDEDPELVSLNVNFRTQKDRLLAWGLDWSDANAAQPNDIDEALGEAGFSDVVAGVMSSIQQVLSEAERLQQPNTARATDSLTKGSSPGGFPAPNQLAAPVKNSWSGEEITRLKELLDQLTALIDTLYDLSISRRNMSMGIAPSAQSTPHTETRKPLPRASADSKMVHTQSYDAVGSPSKKKMARKERHSTYPPLEQIEMAPFINLRTEPNTIPPPVVDLFGPTKQFRIDKAALQLSEPGTRQASNPPPYEAVAASANSRAVGQLKTAALPAPLTASMNEPTVPVLVEFSPISLEMQNSLLLPSDERLHQLCETLDRLLDHTRVSHLGLLKFVGYVVDMTYSRYGFIYQLPLVFFPLLTQPSEKLTPKPLASLFYSGHDREEASIPNLEDRFRLAYDVVLSVLHLRSQNVVHGNMNSNNILVFPGYQFSRGEISSSSDADIRHLYLASLAQFDGGDKNAPSEALSSRIYRHPDDSQRISDPSAWAYDMYSVGLILLEIGLWTPLSRLWKMKYNLSTFKSRIENVYVGKLGSKCGSAFLQAAQLCLDAPNFHLSSEPMTDFRLRFSQASHYPWLEPGDCDDWCTFSKNFVYTIANILFRCSSLDLFSAPPPEDLKENLPPPLDSEAHGSQNVQPQIGTTVDDPHFGRQFDEPVLHWEPERDMPPMPESKKFLREEAHGNPEKRTRKRTLKRWSNEEIPECHLQQWNQYMMPKISRLLQKVLKDSTESCGVSLMVAGETRETAKTTVCINCASVRKVRAALKKYFDYDRENWDVIVMKGGIKRSKVPRARKKKQKATKSTPGDAGGPSRPDPNPYYQRKPLCGASIGAFIQDEHLPPVSYGGVILVDGIPYGMTVHHMLDAPYDEDEEEGESYDQPPRSAANFGGGLQMSEHDFAYSWCDNDPPEASYTFEISDDEDGDDNSIAGSDDGTYDDYWLSDGYSSDEVDDDDSDDASIGDTAGIFPGEEQGIVVTQPAIDDVDDDFFPSPENRDDEHLASHQLGHIHASSGIRRWTRDGIKHEVDWALINIDEERMEPGNTIPGDVDCTADRGATESGQKLSTDINKVAKLDELGGLHVKCCGRTSGLQTGRIARAMALVKLHGRQSFSSSFSVDGNFGGNSKANFLILSMDFLTNLFMQYLVIPALGYLTMLAMYAAMFWPGQTRVEQLISHPCAFCSTTSPVRFERTM